MEEKKLFEEIKPLLDEYIKYSRQEMPDVWNDSRASTMKEREERVYADDREGEILKILDEGKTYNKVLEKTVSIPLDTRRELIEELTQIREAKKQEKQEVIYDIVKEFLDSNKEKMNKEIEEKSQIEEKAWKAKKEATRNQRKAYKLRNLVEKEAGKESKVYKAANEEAKETLEKFETLSKEHNAAKNELEEAKGRLVEFNGKYDGIDFASEAGVYNLFDIIGLQEEKETARMSDGQVFGEDNSKIDDMDEVKKMQEEATKKQEEEQKAETERKAELEKGKSGKGNEETINSKVDFTSKEWKNILKANTDKDKVTIKFNGEFGEYTIENKKDYYTAYYDIEDKENIIINTGLKGIDEELQGFSKEDISKIDMAIYGALKEYDEAHTMENKVSEKRFQYVAAILAPMSDKERKDYMKAKGINISYDLREMDENGENTKQIREYAKNHKAQNIAKVKDEFKPFKLFKDILNKMNTKRLESKETNRKIKKAAKNQAKAIKNPQSQRIAMGRMEERNIKEDLKVSKEVVEKTNEVGKNIAQEKENESKETITLTTAKGEKLKGMGREE